MTKTENKVQQLPDAPSSIFNLPDIQYLAAGALRL